MPNSLAVLRQLIELRLARLGTLVEHRHRLEAAWRRRRGVIHRRDRALRRAYLEPAVAQLGERLRRRHLVHEVEIDVEDRGGRVGLRADEVPLPQLLEQRLRRAHADTRFVDLPGNWIVSPRAALAASSASRVPSRRLTASRYASPDASTTSTCVPWPTNVRPE